MGVLNEKRCNNDILNETSNIFSFSNKKENIEIVCNSFDIEQYIYVLYNRIFGSGFIPSSKVRELYDLQDTNNVNEYHHIFYKNRHDPVLVDIYYELGNDFNGPSSNIFVKMIDKKYEDYYSIIEYGGLEAVVIDYKRFERDKEFAKYKTFYEDIKKIVKNNINHVKGFRPI